LIRFNAASSDQVIVASS